MANFEVDMPQIMEGNLSDPDMQNNETAAAPPAKTQIQVASGHPLGVITFGITTFLFGLMFSHIDSMWFRTTGTGEHHAQALIALMLQWFSMGALFIAGVQQALNNDQTGATSYFFNGMGLGAVGYMVAAPTTTNAIGYVFYALFYFNLLVTFAYWFGNSDALAGSYKNLFTAMFAMFSVFCFFAAMRLTDASYDETNFQENGKYDRNGDYVAGVFALITSFIAAILAMPLLTGKSPALGVSVKVQ